MVRQAHHPEPVEGQYPNSKLQKIPLTPFIKGGKQFWSLTNFILETKV
jgi:hypothetical protein